LKAVKLWQLSSYFRSEPEKLRQVVSDPEWDEIAEHFRDIKELVQRQDRAKLDMELPDELCRQALALTERKYMLEQGHLYRCKNEPREQLMNILRAVQVFDLYGGGCLEEVEEYGSCRIRKDWRVFPMLYFCKCPLDCGDGYLGFWRCADGARIILRCDECEVAWLEPTNVLPQNPFLATPPDYLLPGTSIPMYGKTSGWATRSEIEKVGLASFIKGDSAALGEGSRKFICPCCGYPELEHAPYKSLWGPPVAFNVGPSYSQCYGEPSYEVCDCCGFEFGNDDDPGTASPQSFTEFLKKWVNDGCVWFDISKKPANCTPERQLKEAGLIMPD
jgi:hypothetical protein